MTTDSGVTLADGVLAIEGGKQVVRFQRHLAHPIERVWAALTEPDQLLAWWGDADVDLVEGGRFTVRWLNTDDRGNSPVMHATITRLDPPRLLETSGDIHGVLRWELRPDDRGTTLVLTVSVPAPNNAVRLLRAGWHIHLEHLADALDGRPIDWARWDRDHRPRWEELRAAYAARAS
jgi:uncharacterized protein YndB with AHSA1/START domain